MEQSRSRIYANTITLLSLPSSSSAPSVWRSAGSYQAVPQSIVQTRRDHPRDYVNAMGRALSRGISQFRVAFFF